MEIVSTNDVLVCDFDEEEAVDEALEVTNVDGSVRRPFSDGEALDQQSTSTSTSTNTSTPDDVPLHVQVATDTNVAIDSTLLFGNEAKLLAEIIRGNSNLVSLAFTRIFFPPVKKGQDAFELMAQAAAENQEIQSLTFARSFLSDSRLAFLLNALVGHPSLRRLSLDGNSFGVEASRALKTVLHHPSCCISYLDLSCQNWQVRRRSGRFEGLLLPLLDAIDHSHSLKQLILQDNEISQHRDQLLLLLEVTKRHFHFDHIDMDQVEGGSEEINNSKASPLRDALNLTLQSHRMGLHFRSETLSLWPLVMARTNTKAHFETERAEGLYAHLQTLIGIPGTLQERF